MYIHIYAYFLLNPYQIFQPKSMEFQLWNAAEDQRNGRFWAKGNAKTHKGHMMERKLQRQATPPPF